MTTLDPTPTVSDTSEVADAGGVDAHRFDALDALIAELAAGENLWRETTLERRASLLAATATAVEANASAWVTAAASAKKLDPASQLIGEEWISGPYVVLSSLGTLRHTLSTVAAGASPVGSTKFGLAPGSRVTVPVLPHSSYEALLLHGFSAEVWMLPGVSESTVRSSAGLGALAPTATGGVGLVLGAGNITSIPPLDVLYELIAHNRVSILKLNPVMEPLLPVYEAAFAPLISRGFLRIVTGGADVGSYLAHHPDISHVHITGSAATHDAITWGTGPEASARRAAGTPLLAKPISSELGGVAPIILLPGKWTKRDLRFQAEHVATQRLHNGGYNCIAGQVVVLSSDWPQKQAFLAELRSAIGRAPGRVAWYPGSDSRVAAASDSYPNAERLGPDGCRLLIDVTSPDDSATLQSTEYFSPVLGVIELPGTGMEFFSNAVDTVNTEFAGTLGANIIGMPHTIRSLGAAFLEAVARLRYGTIAINTWTGLGFLTAAAPWGAFPGHSLANVQSGIGIVHNALLLEHTERTVVRGPFRPFPRSFWHGEFALFPKPPWFVTARSAATTGRLLAGFAAHPSWAKMPAVFISAFRA
jgi:aldehyde dehydrogenase (NAD(P)+)